MSERHDNVLDLIERAEKAVGNRRPKLRQEWHGEVAAHLENAASFALRLKDYRNTRWSIVDLVHGANWVSFRAVYTAKGANANDAEKLVRNISEHEVFEIAVNTNRITPVPDV